MDQDKDKQKVHRIYSKAPESQSTRIQRGVRSILDGYLEKKSSTDRYQQEISAITQLLFPVGILLVAIFLLVLSLVLPTEDRTWWAGWAAFIFIIGTWQFDRSRRKLNQPQKGKDHKDHMD